LFLGDCRKILQELRQPLTRLDIVEQRLKRNSRADKHGSSAHDFRIAVHYGLSHDPHFPQPLLKKNTSVARPEPTLPRNLMAQWYNRLPSENEPATDRPLGPLLLPRKNVVRRILSMGVLATGYREEVDGNQLFGVILQKC